MAIIIFDVMCGDRFIMQFTYKWCPAFKLDLEEITREIVKKRPTLKNKKLILCPTTSRVM